MSIVLRKQITVTVHLVLPGAAAEERHWFCAWDPHVISKSWKYDILSGPQSLIMKKDFVLKKGIIEWHPSSVDAPSIEL